MKAKFIFDLDNEQDAFEYLIASNAGKMHSILFEMQNNVYRQLVKHQDVSEDYIAGVAAVFEKFNELMHENNTNLYE